MNKKTKNLLGISRGIALVTQLAISFVTPIFLGILAVRYFAKGGEPNKYWMLFAIVVGTLIGISSSFGLLAQSYKTSGKK